MRELSLHILDVMENSLEAGATRIELTIDEDLSADWLTITIVDNGRGMDEQTVAQVLDPFFTTRQTRHVGLGLPLFAAAAERCNGALTVESQPGRGTTVRAVFQHSHIDRAPMGDMSSTLLGVLLAQRTACPPCLARTPVPPCLRPGQAAALAQAGQAGRADLHYVHRVEGRVFEFDTAEIRQELGDIPLSHPQVRPWLAEFIAEGEREVQLRR